MNKTTPQGVPDWWIYVGQGDGQGAVHKLIQFSQQECITWSTQYGKYSGGWSWLGNWDDFRKQFHAAPSP